MHDVDSELPPSSYRSSKTFNYVNSTNILEDTDFIDSPFIVDNLS